MPQGPQHRLRAGTASTGEHRGVRLHAASHLHRRALFLPGVRPARLHIAERSAICLGLVVVHPNQKPGRRELLAAGPGVRRVHEEGASAVDPICGVSHENRHRRKRVRQSAEGWGRHEGLPRTVARRRRDLASDLLSACGVLRLHLRRPVDHRREALMASMQTDSRRRRIASDVGSVLLVPNNLETPERRDRALAIRKEF